ncbi:tryptophan-rich sensory protein [Sporosarcina sp. CAU 1771]
MLSLILITFALIAMIVVNGSANIVPLNGYTTLEIANKLPILLMPANYVFLIWFFIYLFLTFWIVGFWKQYHREPSRLIKRRTALFFASSLFHIAWIFLWHYGFITWSILAMIGLLITLAALYFSYPKIENRLFQRIPIALFFGWAMILFILNIIYASTFYEWSRFGLSEPLWTVIYLTIATATALHFMYHHRDVVLNLVFMWTFVGIAVKNGFDELFVSSAALFLTVVLLVYLIFMKKEPK